MSNQTQSPINSPNQPAAAPNAHAILHMSLREGGEQECSLTQPETRIGKAPDNTIVLSDAAISSNHLVLRFDGKQHTVTDLGSRNGTFLNEARLLVNEARPLNHGDSIKIGHTILKFRSTVAPPTAPPKAAQPKTEILANDSLGLVPPPPAAPRAPSAPLVPTEDVLARALVNQKLIAAADLERVQKTAPGKRLYRALLENKLSTELGLRDLLCRTFNLEPVDMRAAELDVAMATRLKPPFLREKLVAPLVSGNDTLLLAVADPTDQATLEAIKKLAAKTTVIKLATASEITQKLDHHFLPRLIGEGLDIALNQPEISFGKAPHNKVVLNDTTVSGTHAAVLVRDGGYSVVDLGSSNGTFVNGQRISNDARTLQHGDKLQLGKTLLTFRNPGETVENKTARLSLEALEEIRRRASTGMIGTAAAPRTPPPTGGMPAPSSSVMLEETDEEKAERKRKRKEKEKEKSSWTSAGNLSRIIAQVMGALVALMGPILMYKFGVFGNNDGGGNSGNKPVAAVNTTVKLDAIPPKWTKFSTGLFGKAPEASGAIQVPGANGLLLVDDGRMGNLVWFPLNDLGEQAGELKPVPLNVPFTDAEAITYGNSYVYVITSQSDPANAQAKALMRFNFDPQTQTMRGAQAEIISDLRPFLLQQVPEISARGAAKGMDGGLNIEGMAYDPNNERLLLGLRSPFIGSQAVLVPVRLINSLAPLSLNNIKVDSPSVITLTLDGQGVRDITYDAHSKMFLIISGAPDNEKKTDFMLWEWSGNPNDQPKRLLMLNEKYKPEGIAHMTLNGQDFLIAVGDAGNFVRLNYAK